MELASYQRGEGFALNGLCPHCRAKSAFVTVHPPYTIKLANYTTQSVGIAQCVGCNGFILAIVENDTVRWHYKQHYPVSLPNDDVNDLIPDEIKPAFREALRCRWVVSFQAVVLMCRRCLQVSCDREGAQGGDLFKQIDDLAGKGTITKTLKDMAHRIRLLGKKGAHGDYSDIDDTVTEADADDAILFMRNYLDFVYVLPAKLAPKQTP